MTTPTRWFSLTIRTAPILTEAIEDFLMGIPGAGVELSVDQPGKEVLLNVWFDRSQQDSEEIALLQDRISTYLQDLAEIFQTETPVVTPSFIDNEDWARTWKEHFKPFAIIPGLVIAPTWEPYQAAEGEKVIVMDPGMAFGTGHHATTCLSLQLLQQALTGTNTGHSVLDVGTGTGILAMAAALFGAQRVLALDNDPAAVSAARENCTRNGLTPIMETSLTPLSDIAGTFSVVIANIVHDVLLELAPDLERLTGDSGRLILSGILQGDQAASITACFTARNFSLQHQENKKEWCGLLFQRNGTV